MALGQNYDAVLTVGTQLDSQKLYSQIASITRSVPPLKLRTQGNLPLGQLSRDANEFSKSLAAANSRVTAFAVSAGSLFAISRGMQEIVKSTLEVEKALTDVNVVMGLSTSELGKFSSSLFDVANKTAQSFATASKAALEFSRQGLSVEETLKRTQDALTLTRFTGLGVEESILAITTALNSFDSAALNSTKILEKISAVDVSFAVSGKDLAQGLTRVGSIARDAGVEFDKLLALITSARQISGRTGEVVGTGIGTIIQRLGRRETLETLNALGVATETLTGELLSADQVLVNLAQKWESLTDAQRNNIGALVGGVRQNNILKALMSDLSKESSIYARATLEAANASGIAAQRTDELNKTLSAQLQVLFNQLKEASSTVGNLTIRPVI